MSPGPQLQYKHTDTRQGNVYYSVRYTPDNCLSDCIVCHIITLLTLSWVRHWVKSFFFFVLHEIIAAKQMFVFVSVLSSDLQASKA